MPHDRSGDALKSTPTLAFVPSLGVWRRPRMLASDNLSLTPVRNELFIHTRERQRQRRLDPSPLLSQSQDEVLITTPPPKVDTIVCSAFTATARSMSSTENKTQLDMPGRHQLSGEAGTVDLGWGCHRSL
jgi:hypothetical protein